MKKLFILLVILLSCLKVEALEIVYPKKNPAQINANSTFFIGSTNPSDTLKINDVEVNVSPLGAFAQFVPLNVGENCFKIISGQNSIDFVIKREEPQNITNPIPSQIQTLTEYLVMNFYVTKDDAPLRMTPVDGGINRLSHMPKGMNLLINGEKGNFYRVYLNSKLSGWIAKTDVAQNYEKNIQTPVLLKDIKVKEERDFNLYEFELNARVPFVLKEENGLTVQLFNIAGAPDSTYFLNFPIPKLIGYEGYYEGNKFILKIRKVQQINLHNPLKNIVIAVDAGHGGSEVGAIGCCGDREKDINLAIAKNLYTELKARDAQVVMTRESDIDVSLQDRINFAKYKDATLLISIHANALPDGQDPIQNRGTSVYYYHNQAKPLAQSILDSMITQLGTQNDKVRQGSLALVRPTASVSVLIEVAYIINPDDYALLLDEDFQKKCAKAIADGIENYLKN